MTIGTVTVTAPRTPVARLRRALVVVVLLAVGLLVAPQAFAGTDEPVQSSVSTYTVATGDTLWDIAATLTPAGGDVSVTVADIIQLNRMEGSGLIAGEQILVPVRG